MSSQIRFKFKNAKEGDVVLFEGIALPLGSLKAAIVDKKALTASGVDLVVADAGTGVGACGGRACGADRVRVWDGVEQPARVRL